MVDWDATEYRRVSDLQPWLAARALSGLDLHGVEPCWTWGGGGGRIAAGIATAPDRGEVVAIDPSPRMGQLAASTDAPNGGVPLRFEVGDLLCRSRASSTLSCRSTDSNRITFNNAGTFY